MRWNPLGRPTHTATIPVSGSAGSFERSPPGAAGASTDRDSVSTASASARRSSDRQHRAVGSANDVPEHMICRICEELVPLSDVSRHSRICSIAHKYGRRVKN